MSSRSRLTGWHACVVLVAAGAVVRALAGRGVAAPWIAPDEPTYGMLGRSLWQTGRFVIVGASAPFYGVVYPAFAGLPLTLFDGATGVRVLQVVQAAVMCATALVVYAWGRRLVPPGLALLAAGLTLALPALAYSGLLMTEVAYYPIGTLALLAIARSLETPTLEAQAMAMTAILVASLTRLQGLVLLPVLVTAVLVAAVLERRATIVRRFAPTLVLTAVAAAILLAFHVTGKSSDALGAYSTTASASYGLGDVVRWTLWHAGDLFLLVCGIPLLAVATLAVQGLLRGERAAPVRALLALAVAYAGWSLVQVGAFASRFGGSLSERYLITFAPLAFLGFVVWLHRGLPRPRAAVAASGTLILAAVLTLPGDRLSDPTLEPSSFNALAFVHLGRWTSSSDVRLVWLAGAFVAAALYLLVPRHAAALLPAAVLALLVAGSTLAAVDVRRLAGDLREQLGGQAPLDWVDRAADGRVAYVYAGGAYWNGVWLSAFWNPRIDRVVALADPPPAGPLPPHDVVSPRFDGRLFTTSGRDLGEPYVLAPDRLAFVGTRVRSVAQRTDVGRITLWRIEPPLRLTTITLGVQPNGDIVGNARVDVFSCAPGRLELTVLGKEGRPFSIDVDGVRLETVTVAPGTARALTVRTPPFVRGSTRCSFGIASPGLIGTTRIAFVPDG